MIDKKSPEHKVITYRTTMCPWCHRAEEFFKANNVEFTSINVARDLNAAREMTQKSGQMGVPVIDIDGHIIVGYDVLSFKKLLGRK